MTAVNVIMGCDWAGIHCRSDAAEGIAMGAELAITCLRDPFLQDQVNTFTESFSGFSFTKFDGTAISIQPGTGTYAGINLLTPGY